MAAWASLILGLLSVGLLAWACWSLGRSQRDAGAWRDEWRASCLVLTQRLDHLEESTLPVVVAQAVGQAFRMEQQREQERLAKFPVGSFFPTDEAAAEMEQDLRRAEDHFLSATGPIRYSSTPSALSGPRPAPARSRSPGRRSGPP